MAETMNLLRLGLLLCVASLGNSQPSTKTPPATAVPQWEYKTVHSDKEVNELVAAGWELVTMTSEQQQTNYLMKRRKGRVDPVLVYDVQPHYTKQAFKKHIQGEVAMTLIVTKAGIPSDIRVTKSLDPGLDQSAIAAVKQWRFQPATSDGQPIDARADVSTRFTITRGRDPVQWFPFP